MPDAPAPTFQIPRDVIEPILQAHIAAAVTTAFGDNKAIFESAVRQVLFQKVGDDGTAKGYGPELPWVQWAMRNAVRKATLQAIETEMAKHGDGLKRMIADEFMKGPRKSPLVKQLIESMVGAITDPSTLKYRLTVTCEEK